MQMKKETLRKIVNTLRDFYESCKVFITKNPNRLFLFYGSTSALLINCYTSLLDNLVVWEHQRSNDTPPSVPKADAPLPWQMSFQQPATPTMEGIIDLHHNIMFFMIYIVIFISYILIRAIFLFNSTKKTPFDSVSSIRHYLSLEVIWTILPLIILFWIALPSFALLYSIDHCPKIDLTIKVIGRQWYWTYEIDTFLKYQMRSPNYKDFKEVSLIYEMVLKATETITKNSLFFKNTSDIVLTKEFMSKNNIFFSFLSKLSRNNYSVTSINSEKLINTYVNCIKNVEIADGIVAPMNYLKRGGRLNTDLGGWHTIRAICEMCGEKPATDGPKPQPRSITDPQDVFMIEVLKLLRKRAALIQLEEELNTKYIFRIEMNKLQDKLEKLDNMIKYDAATDLTFIQGIMRPLFTINENFVGWSDFPKDVFAYQYVKMLKIPLTDLYYKNIWAHIKHGWIYQHIPEDVLDWTCHQACRAGYCTVKIVDPESRLVNTGFVENFDQLFSDKHVSGFNLLSKSDFINETIGFYYEDLLLPAIKDEALGNRLISPRRTLSIHYFLYSHMVDLDNELFLLNWNWLSKIFGVLLINPEDASTGTGLIKWITYLAENKAIFSREAISLVFFYNEARDMLDDIIVLSQLKEVALFKHKDLLKDFFNSLVSGELYTFNKKLVKYEGLTIDIFIKDFSDWYTTLQKHILKLNYRVSNPFIFYPLMYEINDNLDWVNKEKGLMEMAKCPSNFFRFSKNYTDWLSFRTLIVDDSKDLPNFFKLYSKIIRVTLLDLMELRRNKVLAGNIMSHDLSLKVFLYFHSLFYKDAMAKSIARQNKIYHYLLEFDSCMVSDNEVYQNFLRAVRNEKNLSLETLPTSFCGWWRLLEVDSRLVLPIRTRLRILVTSSDVLHSWAVPSLGVKIDACPGRLNCIYVYIKRPGIFHGQCSELCGIKHGFMPIVVHAVTRDKYHRWFADNCEYIV